MMHPHVELRKINDTVGYGVFATRLIPRGTITWALDQFDQIFSPARVAALQGTYKELIQKYGYRDGRGDTVLSWDHGRFVNHSCSANCVSPGFDFEVAVRDIQVGEELTDDYRTLGLEMAFECTCGAPRCIGVVRPEDIATETTEWDRAIAEVFPLLRKVEQPLWEFVRDQDAVNAVLDGRSLLPSGGVHLFHEKVREKGK